MKIGSAISTYKLYAAVMDCIFCDNHCRAHCSAHSSSCRLHIRTFREGGTQRSLQGEGCVR